MGSCATLVLSFQAVYAIDIPGVQHVAWDQPQINAAMVRPPAADPLECLDICIGFNFSAILDTGASGIVLAPVYAGGLGFDLLEYEYPDASANPVVFSDVAVGGGVDYNVSEPVEFHLAPYQPLADTNNSATFGTVYDHTLAPGRVQIGPVGTTGPFQVNVIGMPAMVGKVTVVDPRAMDDFLLLFIRTFDIFDLLLYFAQLQTYLYSPGTPYNQATDTTDPGIPLTDRHVQLTMMDASRFTRTVPDPDPSAPYPGLETPMLADNPFIGPNPLNLIDASVPAGSVPGVTVSYGALSSTGSYLLDTGSAATFISTDTAQDLDIRYREGTYGPGLTSPILENITDGTALPGQFQVEVSGLGGTSVVAGFFVDSLLVRTVVGGPQPDDPNHLRYLHTPVFVLDITVVDPDPAPGNGDTITLDGIFGMNMLIASAELLKTSDPREPPGTVPTALPIGGTRLAPFDWVVFDEPNALLGVKIGPSIDDDRDDDGVRDAVLLDGVPPEPDICPYDFDPDQIDTDGDGIGNACDDDIDGDESCTPAADTTENDCDSDDDNDGDLDGADNCPIHPNPDQADSDGDGDGDACDYDLDNDGEPDVTDSDDDNDGLADPDDAAPLNHDGDSDGIIDGLDPEPETASNNPMCENTSGPLATVSFTQMIGGAGTELVTCAATQKITLAPPARVQDGGTLILIAPKVGFDPLSVPVFVDAGGILKIISRDPTALIPNTAP